MITTLYAGGYDEPNIGNEGGSWGAGANLKNGLNCHELSHFVGWGTVAGATGYALERRPMGGIWAEVYRGKSATFLDNMTVGGKFEYRWKPLGAGGIEGQWSEPLLYVVKPPPMTLIVTKTCNSVALSWTAVALEYIIYKDDVAVGYTTATSWSGSVAQGGTFIFKVRGFVTPYIEGVPNCYVEATSVVSLLTPQPTGTVISSGCVGNQDITIVADGNCGETPTVTKTWECNGCFDILRGEVGPRFCQANQVAKYAYTETCSNNVYTKILETCTGACLNGACVPPFECSNTNQQATGLGLPSPASWEAQYNLGTIHTDGICVQAWYTKSGNLDTKVEIYLNDLVVFAVSLGGAPANIKMSPPWTTAVGHIWGGAKDPNAHLYTKWEGNIRVRVYALGSIGLGYGEVKLDAVSWRNI